MDYETIPTISTPNCENSLEDFSHIFGSKNPGVITASPPMFSNVVYKTIHNSVINLDILFSILPIIYISPDEIALNNNIDFNETFLSIRKYPNHRGFRGNIEIKSFMDMDFYFSNRNFHIKISPENMTIVGGQNYETSKLVLEVIYLKINKLNNKWNKFNTLDKDVLIKICELFEKEEELPDDLSENKSYVKFYNFLKCVIDRNEENVRERLCKINSCFGSSLLTNDLSFSNLVTCNSVFNYWLPEKLLLKNKSQILLEKGYEVIYHNLTMPKHMDVKYYNKNGKKFSFSIQNIGTIRQNSSCSYEENVEMYRQLVTDLGFLPYEEGCTFSDKLKPVKINKCNPSKFVKEIFSYYLKVD